MANVSPYAPSELDYNLDVGSNLPPSDYVPADLRDGRFAVFLRHRDSREWWRLVAIFSTWDRAERYAGVENDCMVDMKERATYTNDASNQELTPAPDILPPELPTAVTPENFFPTETRQQIETVLIEHSTRETRTSTTTVAVGKNPAGPPWAPQEAEFRQMWTDGVEVEVIGRKLERSVSAIYDRAKLWQLGPHPKTGNTTPAIPEVRNEAIASNALVIADPATPPKRRAELEAINEFLEKKGATKVPAAYQP